jgi:pyruvate,water dikinase
MARVRDMLTEAWDIHMRVNVPAMNSAFGFEEFLTAVLGEEGASQSRLLLQGFDNKSVETGRVLWEISRWARSNGFADAILNSRVRDGAVDIGSHPAAGEFQERWKAFLETYGWRSDVFMEPGHASWREDPSSALTQLKGFLRKDDSEDPFISHRRQAEERDRKVAEFEARLPAEVKPQFRGMLALAQQYVPIAEDHNFTIDQKFTMVVRHAALELGKKLVADGLVKDPEDVFYLVADEIEAIGNGGKGDGLANLVRQRRHDRVRQGSLNPPPAIGTPPPADMAPPPLITKFFGFGVVQTGDPKVVSGYPCSSGVVTGIARVVMTLDQADKVGPGDILVCPMTMPAWTPLFGVVAAVVADSGGPLSHCAIVAREYEIPCVAGTLVGTSTIRDGARVRVDGGTGTVHILDK